MVAGANASARVPHYKHGGATYGDLAYDLDAMSREYALRHAGEPVRREAMPAPQVRRVTPARRREQQKVSVVSILGFSAVAVLVVLLLMNYVKLTQISESVVTLKAELTQLETDNIALTTKYEQTFDLATVREAAEAAGMTKPSRSQQYYIDQSDSDNVVIYQQEESGVLSRVLTSLNHGVCTVVEYFD